MDLKISELPMEAQEKIPLSIRSYKDDYKLEDLPASIRTMLDKYLSRSPDVEYNIAYDVTPNVSEYGDFKTIQDVTSLVVEYLKNYFMIFPEDYPFDPYFGSRLKSFLQMKDTSLQKTLISNEVDNIVTALSGDLNIKIKVIEITIAPINQSTFIEYNILIKVQIGETIANISL